MVRLPFVAFVCVSVIACAPRRPPVPPPPEPGPPPGSVCAYRHGDCDGDEANGCETNLTTAALHCGACGHGCGPGQYCEEGECRGGPIVELASDAYRTCGRHGDGRVTCWGDAVTGHVDRWGWVGRTPARLDDLHRRIEGLSSTFHHLCLLWGGRASCATSVGQSHQLRVPEGGEVLHSRGGLECTRGPEGSLSCEGVVGLPEAGVAEIAMGVAHVCARTVEGRVVCAGADTQGQLGDGEPGEQAGPVEVVASGAIDIDVGQRRSCAVLEGGAVTCWGAWGIEERLPVEGAEVSPTPVDGVASAARVEVGTAHACAVGEDRRVVCWGDNGLGQLGAGDVRSHESPVLVDGVDDVTSLAVGAFHACALSEGGAVRCWGWPQRLGAVAREDVGPGVVPGVTATRLGGGDQLTCAVDEAGAVACWGLGRRGLLGTRHTPVSYGPRVVPGLSRVDRVVADESRACALSRGRVSCWGEVHAGAEAEAPPTGPTPIPIPGLRRARDLALGGDRICVLGADRKVRCWSPALGAPDAPPNEAFGELIDFAVADDVACGVRQGGEVVCEGQRAGIPEELAVVEGVPSATAVRVSRSEACALSTGGEVWCWGPSTHRPRSGEGTGASRVEGLVDVAELGVGGGFGCARREGGEVWCWGYGRQGQLGRAIDDFGQPAPVPGVTDAVSLTVGLGHACAASSEGEVTCWGATRLGRLPVPAEAVGPIRVVAGN